MKTFPCFCDVVLHPYLAPHLVLEGAVPFRQSLQSGSLDKAQQWICTWLLYCCHGQNWICFFIPASRLAWLIIIDL